MLNIFVDNGADKIRSIFLILSGSVKAVSTLICTIILLWPGKYYKTVNNIIKILRILIIN